SGHHRRASRCDDQRQAGAGRRRRRHHRRGLAQRAVDRRAPRPHRPRSPRGARRMSIVITPGPSHLRVEPTPAGRLAGSLLSVTVAGLADPQRSRRGKTYLADNAISRLELSEGVLLATVAGHRADPYHVTITVETISRPEGLAQIPERSHVARLIPRGDDLLFSCTCPDWDDPCKHAVAAMLAFAAELSARPELLAIWRCCELGAGQRRKVASRARADRHLRLVQPAPPKSPFETT